jgi:hypothetical protein
MSDNKNKQKMCYLFDIDIIERKQYPQFPKLPNHALMKFSSYYKEKGYDVTLVYNKKLIPHMYDPNNVYIGSALFNENLERFKKRFNHKVVFKSTLTLERITIGRPNDSYPDPAIEQCKCDYTEYTDMINNTNVKLGWWPANVGFLTRGCYRHCDFCVNRDRNEIVRVNELEDIYVNKGVYIELLDDNLFASDDAVELLNKIGKFHKKHKVLFKLRNGLDCRSISPEKIKALENANPAFEAFHCAWDNAKHTFIFKNIKEIKKNVHGISLRCHMIFGVGVTTKEELKKDLLSFFYRYYCLRSIRVDPVPSLFEDDTGKYVNPYWDLYRTLRMTYNAMAKSRRQYLKRKLGVAYLGLADKIIEVLDEYSWLAEKRVGEILDMPDLNDKLKQIANEIGIKHRDI